LKKEKAKQRKDAPFSTTKGRVFLQNQMMSKICNRKVMMHKEREPDEKAARKTKAGLPKKHKN
jgi:hypothetical protein